jgi:superfamily II DNA or RNA helicase
VSFRTVRKRKLVIRLEIDNSQCRITGLSDAQFTKLRDILSYTESTKSVYYNGFKSTKRNLMDRTGVFPTGLLYLVQKYLEPMKDPSAVQTVDKRKRPKTHQLGLQSLFVKGDLKPYPEQLEAARAALTHGRGIVVAPTGVGKSFIAALVCEAFQVKTLIVVPSLELKAQTLSSLQNAFGADKVGPLDLSGEAGKFITVENVDALDTKRNLKGVDLVIIDEFHHSGAKTYRDLNKKAWSSVYFKIGMTATPFRSQEHERLLLESVLSKVIYRIEYKTAVEKGYIVPLEAYYYDLPAIPLQCNPKNYAAVYSELFVKREDRNQLIAQLVANLHDQDASTLVLSKQIEHGEELARIIKAKSGLTVPFAQGANDNNRQLILEFNLREHIALIGTVGVLGEGVDTKPAEWIILAGGGKSKNQFMQNCGRAFRVFPGKESGKVILFRDPSHKWMLDHFRQCCKHLLEEYGIVPVKLPLPKDFV